jgi:hypothetical protein
MLQGNYVEQRAALWEPQANLYTEPLEQVLREGCLAFQKDRTFKAAGHSTLHESERLLFEHDLKRNRFKAQFDNLQKVIASVKIHGVLFTIKRCVNYIIRKL